MKQQLIIDIMTKYESYAQRHKREEPRAITPNPFPNKRTPKDEFVLEQLNGKASKMEVSLLNQRLFQVENKMTALTNIVKLVQKYTETQDVQYQKEKKVISGKQSMLNGLISDHEQMMRRQQEQLIELQETHRMIKEQSLTGLVEEMAQSIRREMNFKIQICMNEMRSPILHNPSSTQVNDKEIERIRQKITRLQQQITHPSNKFISKKQFSNFKEEVNNEISNVMDKFTKLVKKYMDTQAMTPIRSPAKSPKQTTIASPGKNILVDKPTVRLLNKNQSQQNIHPNRPQTRSRSKSKQKSVVKKSLSRNNSPQARVSDKRKQKQQQLKEIIKKSKDKRALIR